MNTLVLVALSVTLGMAIVIWAVHSKGVESRVGAASRRQPRAAARDLRELAPLWALGAPFADGTESFVYFNAAYLSVSGFEDWSENISLFDGHAEAFNADPDSWNELAASQPSPSPRMRALMVESLDTLRTLLEMPDEPEGAIEGADIGGSGSLINSTAGSGTPEHR